MNHQRSVLAALALGISVLLGNNAHATHAIGIKTGLAYMYALSDITQIPLSDSAITLMYNRVKSRLPIHGQFEELNEPVLFGISSMGGEFCTKLVDNEILKPQPYQRLVAKDIILSKGPAAATTEAREMMINDHSQLFLGRNATAGEIALFQNYLDEAAKIVTDDGNGTREWIISTCAQYATSLEFLLN